MASLTHAHTHTRPIRHAQTCGSCVSKIERAVSRMDGVLGVQVSLATKKAHIEYDPENTGVRDIIQVGGAWRGVGGVCGVPMWWRSRWLSLVVLYAPGGRWVCSFHPLTHPSYSNSSLPIGTQSINDMETFAATLATGEVDVDRLTGKEETEHYKYLFRLSLWFTVPTILIHMVWLQPLVVFGGGSRVAWFRRGHVECWLCNRHFCVFLCATPHSRPTRPAHDENDLSVVLVVSPLLKPLMLTPPPLSLHCSSCP